MTQKHEASGMSNNLLAAITIAYLFAHAAFAADITWGNASGGRWGDAANWVGGVLPGASDRAILGLPVTVEVDDNRTVGAFQVADGATLLIRGNGPRGHAVLSTSGLGEVLGTVRMDSSHASYYSYLSATGTGQLQIQPSGHIDIVIGTGLGRHLVGNLTNRGQIVADGGFDPATINFTGGTYVADGGTITGPVYARAKAISTGASPATESTILVANDCSIVSDIAAGYVIQPTGTGFVGNSVCTIPASITNHGTIRLASAHTSYYSHVSGSAGAVITNAADGAIQAVAGGNPNRYFYCDVTNDGSVSTEAGVTCYATGAFLQRNGSIAAAGKWQLDSGSFTFAGGTSGGNVYCSGVTVDVASTVSDASSFRIEDDQNVLAKNDSPAVTMTLEGNSAIGNAVVNVAADAVNRGTIRLDSAHANYYSQLAVSSGVTLTNAATGTIEFAHNGNLYRYLQGNLINQGQIVADAAFDPATISFSGGTYVADGGTITGPVYARAKAISTGASPATESTILVANGCSIVSDIAAGYVIQPTGTGFVGNSVCTIPASVTNHGTIRLASAHTSYYSHVSGSAGAVITNAADGAIQAVAGGNPNRYFYCDVTNDGSVSTEAGVTCYATGAFLQRNGSIAAAGKWQLDSGSFTFTGGTSNGNVYCSGVTVDVASTVSDASSFRIEDDQNVLVKNDSPAVTMTLEGNSTIGHSVVNVAADAVNRGTIRLDSAHANYYSQLAVSSGVTLTNAATGTIEFAHNGNLYRYLQGNLINQGQIVADAAFDPATISFSGGTYVADGGTITGPVYARAKAISTGASPATESTILVANGCSIVSDIAAGYVIQPTGTGFVGNSVCTIPASITNHGTIRLASAHASYYSYIQMGEEAALTNGAAGTFHAAAGGHSSRFVTGSFINQGLLKIDAGVLLSATSIEQLDSGVYESQIGGLTSNLFSRLAVSGRFDLSGAMRIARVNNFDPVLGDQFQILTFGSLSHRISCGDVEGLHISGNLRFSLNWNPTNLTLEVVDAAVIPSDPNCDCQIDLTDLAAVLSNFGTPAGMTYADGDFDLDGDVDLSDLAYLLSNFGSSCN